MILPNKWLRKAIFDALDGLEVNREPINVYDTNVTSREDLAHYIVLSTQTATVTRSNSCKDLWNATIIIEAVTVEPNAGLGGSRVKLDNVTQLVYDRLTNLEFHEQAGLNFFSYRLDSKNTLSSTTNNKLINRNILQLTAVIH